MPRKRKPPPQSLSLDARIVLQSAKGAGKKVAGELIRQSREQSYLTAPIDPWDYINFARNTLKRKSNG